MNNLFRIRILQHGLKFFLKSELNWAESNKTRHLLLCKTYLRRLEDMSSRRLQHVFRVTIFRLPRRLEEAMKTSWKTKNCYAEDVFKTSWRRFGDKENVYWYLCLTNLNVYLTNLYFSNLYLTYLTRIQNALIRTQYFWYFSYIETQAAFPF